MLKRISVFVTLRTYDNYIPANMMLQRLEEEHIRAYLQNELTDPIFAHAVGGIKLMVHEGQIGRAMELIDGFEALHRKAITCTQCGSNDVGLAPSVNNSGSWLSSLFAWFRGSFLQTPKPSYRCFNCSLEFDEIPFQPEIIYRPFKGEFKEGQEN